MPRSIRSRVIGELSLLPFADDTLTSSQLGALLKVRLSSLSSVLNRMAKRGEVVRVPDVGPRGGYGYRLKTSSEAMPSPDVIRDLIERAVG